MFELILMCQHLADWIGVASLERHQCGVDDTLVFTGKFLADYSFQLLHIEAENFRDKTEDENILALVLGCAPECLNGQSGNRNAHVNETFVVEIRFDIIRIVKEDPA